METHGVTAARITITAHDGHDGMHAQASPSTSTCSWLLCLLTSAFVLHVFRPGGAPISRPPIGWAFMMAVSCTKAMLVILFFMHVMYEANWKYVLTIPAAIMSMFLISDARCPTSAYAERVHQSERAKIPDRGGADGCEKPCRPRR